MKLPDALAAEFRQDRPGPPLACARSLYDLEGDLGETYAAADAQALVLFSRPIGGPVSKRLLAWADVRDATLRAEEVFVFLDLQTDAERVSLQFSPWDEPVVQQLTRLWAGRAGARPAPGGAPTALAPVPIRAVAGPLAVAAPRVRPLVAFCASIHAIIECDDRVEPAELNYLAQRVPDAEAIREGHAFLERHGLETLCAGLRESLDEVQRQCACANWLGVAMVDGALRSQEQALLERFQEAVEIPELERATLFEVLLAKNNLAVFAADIDAGLAEPDGLTPLLAYCAALHAMMQADASSSPDEEALLALTVPFPEDVRLGNDYLHAYGPEHLLGRLPEVLQPAQRTCLMANLISLVMVDGLIRRAEQDWLDRFQSALQIPEAEFQKLYGALMVKNNLAVFAD